MFGYIVGTILLTRGCFSANSLSMSCQKVGTAEGSDPLRILDCLLDHSHIYTILALTYYVEHERHETVTMASYYETALACGSDKALQRLVGTSNL